MYHHLWQKLGCLVPAFTLGSLLIVGGLLREPDQRLITDLGAPPLSAAFATSALAVFAASRWVDRRARRVFDPRRGKVVPLRVGHTFLLLDLAAWPWILLVGAVLTALIR